MSQYHPRLPQDLITRFATDPDTKTSEIFTQKSRETLRFQVLLRRLTSVEYNETHLSLYSEIHWPCDAITSFGATPLSPEIGRNLDNFGPGAKKSWLHASIRQEGDIPSVYEFIRMGIDSDGVTPLFFTMELLFMFSRTYDIAIRQPESVIRMKTMFPDINPGCIKKTMGKLATIAKLLIEQHADVDVGAFGFTPLLLAADSGQWDFVRLLLLHGARRPGLHDPQPRSSAARVRLSLLIQETKATNPRPARPCPCWSGKTLSECHAASLHPYPEHFLCGCGALRTYADCCGKRGIVIEEKWNEDLRRIKAIQHQRFLAPRNGDKTTVEAVMEDDEKFWKLVNANPELKVVQPYLDHVKKHKGQVTMLMLKKLGREAEMDPAFLFALDNVPWIPKPWEGIISKIESYDSMREWNAHVDRYIATIPDPRPRIEIEIQSKIGPHGGPLYRFCEAKGCNKVEGRELEKMQGCAGCHLVFYCSRECQKRDWKEHKTECKAKTHRPQQLHSQWLLDWCASETLFRRDPVFQETYDAVGSPTRL
ncbi:hypothetical protein D9758_008095 [Tetrapyrgos nigripes]|uniref:MYND-type domain-containing protein n=1 Tax=Tetrapyrgos nigripes TaxID=182062 RepID=A0A8H5GH97_9AGAR|nr:hypothetical protein D9758_008095 [Tetrapyrgos nigripes]